MFQVHIYAAGKVTRKGQTMAPITTIKINPKALAMVKLLSLNVPGRVQWLANGDAIIWNSTEHRQLMERQANA